MKLNSFLFFEVVLLCVSAIEFENGDTISLTKEKEFDELEDQVVYSTDILSVDDLESSRDVKSISLDDNTNGGMIVKPYKTLLVLQPRSRDSDSNKHNDYGNIGNPKSDIEDAIPIYVQKLTDPRFLPTSNNNRHRRTICPNCHKEQQGEVDESGTFKRSDYEVRPINKDTDGQAAGYNSGIRGLEYGSRGVIPFFNRLSGEHFEQDNKYNGGRHTRPYVSRPGTYFYPAQGQNWNQKDEYGSNNNEDDNQRGVTGKLNNGNGGFDGYYSDDGGDSQPNGCFGGYCGGGQQNRNHQGGGRNFAFASASASSDGNGQSSSRSYAYGR